VSGSKPTPITVGSGAIYGHSAEGMKAAEEDVVIPGVAKDAETSEAAPEVKHEDGLA
jgi:hypothetical protein